MQNTVGIHIESEGNGAPRTIGPWDWVFNHKWHSLLAMEMTKSASVAMQPGRQIVAHKNTIY
jgi:hypothetical protein